MSVETPELPPDAYPESLAALRRRIHYNGDELFGEHNTQLRFDQLLVDYERQTRGIINTNHSDETFNFEEGRVDDDRARDVAIHQLVYPVQSIDTVEWQIDKDRGFETLEPDWYEQRDHGVELTAGLRHLHHGPHRDNPLDGDATRLTWRDVAERVRVTYDRGFETVPPEVVDVQTALINRKLRLLRQEQTTAAASPDELAGVGPQFDQLMTEDMRSRINDLTNIDGVAGIV